MDGSQFDDITRSLSALRTRRTAVATLGAALGAPVLATLNAAAKKKHHKRKKKCAKKCQDGCCTGKYGTCIRPGQQSLGQCGTGGVMCRSTGCAGTCPNCPCSASSPCPQGQCCDGKGNCGSCLVFMSSTSGTGDLGGLAGADDTCQHLAEAANLPGTYMAWLSDSTGSPATRFTRATVPYIRVDGEVVAQNWDDLTDGSDSRLIRAINLTEGGVGGAISPNQVWTSTGDDGEQQVNPDNCDDWSKSTDAFNGDFGLKSSIGPAWTGSDTRACNLASRIYCFQQA